MSVFPSCIRHCDEQWGDLEAAPTIYTHHLEGFWDGEEEHRGANPGGSSFSGGKDQEHTW